MSDQALSTAYSQLRRGLLSTIRRQVRDPQLAEDLLHDVFVKATRALRDGRAPGNLQGWLHQVVRTTVADHYRGARLDVHSLEHDPVFAAKTRALLEQFDVNAWATVIDAPLVSRESSSPWYSLDGLPKALTTIDALVVDGPPASGAPLARYPALPRFADKMSAGAIVIVDDAQRPDETRMLQKWATEFPEFKQSDLYCEKGCILLQRSALTLPH